MSVMESKVLDHGYLKFIESWGSDERIIEAARMSTQKGFKGWGPVHSEECKIQADIASMYRPEAPGCICTPKTGDEKLLRYLWEHKHHTPFEMAGLTIEVQAPIFVFREWHRHRTQSYNELSGRYTELPDMYYIPSVERLQNSKQSKTNKQSSEAGFTEDQAKGQQHIFATVYEDCRQIYEALLARGISREVARIVVPVGQYSRMRASANLRNWLAFLTLRMDSSAQWEIVQYANALSDIIKERFPRTYALFEESRQ